MLRSQASLERAPHPGKHEAWNQAIPKMAMAAVLVGLVVAGLVIYTLRQNDLNTSLEAAMQRGDRTAMRMLILAGADPSVDLGYGSVNKTTMAFATEEGDLALMEALFKRGVRPDIPVYHCDTKPLLSAAEAGQLAAVRLLLDRGVPADILSGDQTSLVCAAGGGHRAVVDLLLERGANPMRVDSWGSTPFHAAAWGGDVGIIRLFLSRGVMVNTISRDGVTPLMQAARNGKLAAVTLLLEAGANPCAKTSKGLTARASAVKWKHPEVARILLRAERAWARKHVRATAKPDRVQQTDRSAGQAPARSSGL